MPHAFSHVSSLMGAKTNAYSLRLSPYEAKCGAFHRVEVEIFARLEALIGQLYADDAIDREDTEGRVLVIPANNVKSVILIPEFVGIEAIAARLFSPRRGFR